MSRRLSILTAAILVYAATAGAQGTSTAKPAGPDQDKPAPFRVAVDVVAVDVQVIDKEGRPVPDLGPEKFNVTINGRRRRVVVDAPLAGLPTAWHLSERLPSATGLTAVMPSFR